MIDYFKPFIDHLLSKTTSIRTKVVLVLSIPIFLISTDLLLGISESIHIDSKLKHIEKIATIKDSLKLDSVRLIEVNRLEKIVYSDQHYKEQLIYLFNVATKQIKRFDASMISDLVSTSDSVIAENKIETIDTNRTLIAESSDTINKDITIESGSNIKAINTSVIIESRNYWLMFFSSNFGLIIIVTLISFGIFIDYDVRLNAIFGLLLVLGCFVAIAMLKTYLAYEIPLIWSRPWLNYLVNFITSIGLNVLFINMIIRLQKRIERRANIA